MKMPRVYTFDVPDFDDCGGRTMRRVEVPKRTFREIEAHVAAPLESELAASAARVQALEGEVARLRNALARCADIVRYNLHRQNEKVDDVILIARAALANLRGEK